MKKLFLILALEWVFSQSATAQLLPTITPANVTAAQTIINTEITGLANNQLVTNYTFRRIFADEFAKILSVENFSSSSVRYATLKIDEDKSTFAFSPLVAHWGNQQNGEPLKGYFNLSIKGEVNSDEVATLFNSEGFNRNFELGFNFNFLLNRSSNFHDVTVAQMPQFRADQNAITNDVAAYFNSFLPPATVQPLSFIENKDALTDIRELNKAFRKKFSEAEEKIAAPHWTSKSKYWFGASASLGYTTQSALNTINKDRTTLDYFNPSALLSINALKDLINSGISLYGILYIKGDTKNSFTGKDAISWNQISKINDTTFTIREQKDVYNYNPNDYTKEFLPTLGAQGIIMYNGKIGFDVSLKHEWLVKNATENKRARKTNQTYGLIFPFNDKDGERTINIELFYSHDTYNVASLDNDEFFGAKFSIPIFSK